MQVTVVILDCIWLQLFVLGVKAVFAIDIT